MAETATIDLRHGDCLAVLKEIPDNSVDSVVCDPPYGLSDVSPAQIADVMTAWCSGDRLAAPSGRGFMGKSWDAFVPPPAVWDECLRVLKPGGHMLVFAGSRTQDLMGLSIRLAGFELRDSLAWIYGSGFPKSMDVSKAIDKAVGVEGKRGPMKRGGERLARLEDGKRDGGGTWGDESGRDPYTYVAGSPEAERWSGWGTALKSAHEPVLCARKPLTGTVAGNVLEWGTGALNIDASRVATDWSTDPTRRGWQGRNLASESGVPFVDHNKAESQPNPSGRWPANVLLDPEAAEAMDEQSGTGTSRKGKPRKSKAPGDGYGMTHTGAEYDDSGGASRFFPVFKYQAKAPKRERPVIEREDGTKVQHPTVKPLALMEWLVALVTPPGGVVLDPFAGSGTTLQAARDKGFHAIGIEAEADYIALIEERLSASDPFLA